MVKFHVWREHVCYIDPYWPDDCPEQRGPRLVVEGDDDTSGRQVVSVLLLTAPAKTTLSLLN